MPKLTLTDIASGYASITRLNNNFTAIENAIENTLSRDGTSPNHMNAPLDMNSNPIHNVGRATQNSDAMSYAQFLEAVATEENLTGVIPITWEFLSTGNASYTLPLVVTDAVDMFIVSVSGGLYPPSSYVINPANQTLTFVNNIPPSGEAVVVRLFGKTPEATTDSITVNNIRASSIQTVVGLETTFNTTFTLDSASTDVYLNGIKLVRVVDYAVGATSITLTSSATAGDTLEIVSHSVILAASSYVLAAQQSATDAALAASQAAQSAIDASVAGSLAGAVAGSEGISWVTKVANYTAVHANGVFADTTAGPFTVTLPATPSVGQYVHIVDVASMFSTNNLTIARNGEYIMGVDEDMTVRSRNLAIKLVYSGAANGWRII